MFGLCGESLTVLKSVSTKRAGFLQGLTAGALGAWLSGLGLMIYLLNAGSVEGALAAYAPGVQKILGWAYRNFGLSLPVFALLLFLFAYSLRTLRQHLCNGSPVEKVVQAEHLTDIWTSMFFGVGVIWTAIGMRGALLFALGDPAETVAEGAFTLLQRMVEGGMLLALSTTILGGIGGYLMRIVKTISVGATLNRYYHQVARSQGVDIHDTLTAIERHLRALAEGSLATEEFGDEQAPVGERYSRSGS